MYQQAKGMHPSYIESGLQRVWQASQKDGDKLSPVDLAIEAASPIHLAPLTWTDYDQTPTSMTVTNSGFTVMVNACFDGGHMPRVSHGPLCTEYVFSQIHFHWGDHNQTGSGHAVKGVRYPLEMHVVHVKNDCGSLKEALKSKDGIVVMVYLFALREERNTQLDQLTAILQFIQRARACARLHPTALSELVPPFSIDYFLYWGAVGSPSGRYRILWMVCRNVLPVSTQQLREFRQLHDSQGKLLVSNSSRPHSLGGRMLFLVSPSEQTKQTMYGIVCQSTGRREDLYNDTSTDIRDAEYKSLGNLEVVNEHCRICPVPKRLQTTTQVNVGYPYKVNEGDTSIEESCIDLSNTTDEDPGVTVKTKTKTDPSGQRVTNVTNVNVTTCRHRYKARGAPSEEVYSVVSARGSELHLRRRPVRQHEPSVEQACMLLSATRSSSAPSLTSHRTLAPTQERTHLPDEPPAITKLSSEVAVHDRYSSEMEVPPPRRPLHTEYDEYEDETYEEYLRNSNRARRVTLVEKHYQVHNYEDSMNNQLAGRERTGISQITVPQNGRFFDKRVEDNEYDQYYRGDPRESEHNKSSQYFLVKQMQDKKPFYKVISELPKGFSENESTPKVDPEANINCSTFKTEEDVTVLHTQGQSNYSKFRHEKSYNEKDRRKIILESEKGKEEAKNSKNYNETGKQNPKPEINITTESDPHYKVSLLVRATVSPEKKPRGSVQKYYVTKISPKDQPIFVTPRSSNTKVENCYGKVNEEQYYYAEPIVENETPESDIPNKSADYTTNEAYKSEYEETIDESHKQLREEQYSRKIGQKAFKTENNSNPSQTLKSDQNVTKQLQSKSVYDISPYNQDINDNNIVESRHENPTENITQKFSSSKTSSDTIKHSNLVERRNIYRGKNPPDEDIQVVNKIITGTVGKSNSTEVFIQDQNVAIVNPRKTDVSKEVSYNLVTSKHPEPQYYVKEPENDSDPRTVIRQHLSLDQQIQGQSQVRQTVEYHDDRPKSSRHPQKLPETSKSNQLPRNMTIATFEESNHEQISTTKKTQHGYRSVVQGERWDPENDQKDYNENSNQSMHDDNNELRMQSLVDPKSALSKGHTTNSTELTSNIQNGVVSHISNDISQVTKVDIPTPINDMESSKEVQQQLKNLRNADMSIYEYEESSSVQENFESSKVKKRMQYVGKPSLQIPERIDGKNVDNNRPELNDNLPSKPPGCIISDKRPKVSFQNDNNQNIYKEVKYEEITEEDSFYTSQMMRGKKMTSHIRGRSPHQMPEQIKPQLRSPSSHSVIVKKIEIPEPHYITRVPKQPLVEFEAFPVDPHEPFQIVSESQEESSTVKTHTTFMMFKKINGKAVLNQPSVIEPMTIKSHRKEQSVNDPLLIQQAKRSQYSQDEVGNNKKSTNEQSELDPLGNDKHRYGQTSYDQSAVEESVKNKPRAGQGKHNDPLNEVSRVEQTGSKQHLQSQIQNDQSRFEEQQKSEWHRPTKNNSLILMKSQTAPTLSVTAENHIFDEELTEENITHDKHSQSVRKNQIRSTFPIEVSKKTTQTIIGKDYDNQPNTNEEIEVESKNTNTRQKDPQDVIVKKTNTQPTLPRDADRGVLAEYEYSETSLLSQQKIIRKQKRYMYNVQQHPIFEDHTPAISKNNMQAIDNGNSNTKDKQTPHNEPQQEEQKQNMPTQDELDQGSSRFAKDTPHWNMNVERGRVYQRDNQDIDEESYESDINLNKTTASKRKFDQREVNLEPLQPQEEGVVQVSLSRKQNNQREEENADSNKPGTLQQVRNASQVIQNNTPQKKNVEKHNASQNNNFYINEEYNVNSRKSNKTHKSFRRQFESNQRHDNMDHVGIQPEHFHTMPHQSQYRIDVPPQNKNTANDDEKLNENTQYNSSGQLAENQRTRTDFDSNEPGPSQRLSGTSQYIRTAQDIPSQNRTTERENTDQTAYQYINQQYYESSSNKNKSYKSSTKKFISNERPGLDPRLSQPGPSQSMPLPIPGSNHIFLMNEELKEEDEPTKDTSEPRANKNTGGQVSEFSINQKSNTRQSYDNKGRGHSFQGDKSNPLVVKSLGKTVPSTKKDGDIVIYIRQPRIKKEHIIPKITVDVTDKHKVSPAQIDQQTVKIQELKPKRTNTEKRINARKSKSDNVYRQPNNTESSTDEDMETSLQTESNEEQVLDTTHYNLTLKSQTKVDISKNEKANVKSMAEVKITPLSSRPRVDLEESCSDVKMTEETETSFETSSAEATACDTQDAYPSPIKIDTSTATTRQYPRIRFYNHWNINGEALLENNGKTLRASLPDFKEEDVPYIESGPLIGRYNFYELHFHWGWKDCCGAEHIIDGQRHTLEAHFLYIKEEYKTLETGMQYGDGLAAVGVKFDVGGPPHAGLGELIADLPLIRQADTGLYVAAASVFLWLMPAVEAARGYFTYKGMLTKNPPCVDCVTWLVFPQPIIFCCQQSSEFRKLKSSTGEELKKNFRTPQPLNNRPVYYVPLS